MDELKKYQRWRLITDPTQVDAAGNLHDAGVALAGIVKVYELPRSISSHEVCIYYEADPEAESIGDVSWAVYAAGDLVPWDSTNYNKCCQRLPGTIRRSLTQNTTADIFKTRAKYLVIVAETVHEELPDTVKVYFDVASYNERDLSKI